MSPLAVQLVTLLLTVYGVRDRDTLIPEPAETSSRKQRKSASTGMLAGPVKVQWVADALNRITKSIDDAGEMVRAARGD